MDPNSVRFVLAVGHGTRDADGTREFLQLVDRLRGLRPEVVFEPCFLEMQSPTIAEAMSRLKEHGANEAIAAPVLLFAAGHAKRDIPESLAKAGERLAMRIWQAAPLGCHPHVVRAALDRFECALAGRPPADEQTALVIVGRGSVDPEANSDLARFARLRYEARPAGWLQTCYVAMTRPSLPEALAAVAQLPYRRVAVQPHLLFAGALRDQVVQTAQAFAAEHPDREVIVTPHLGPHPLVAAALLERIEQAKGDKNLRRHDPIGSQQSLGQATDETPIQHG